MECIYVVRSTTTNAASGFIEGAAAGGWLAAALSPVLGAGLLDERKYYGRSRGEDYVGNSTADRG